MMPHPEAVPQSIFCEKVGGALAQYPHAKKVGSMIFLSGLSARQKDNSVLGVEVLSNGETLRSIEKQTEGVLEKLFKVL
jgi:enamine deaminase RidA (YjgF/YER057c/UK114 family)